MLDVIPSNLSKYVFVVLGNLQSSQACQIFPRFPSYGSHLEKIRAVNFHRNLIPKNSILNPENHRRHNDMKLNCSVIVIVDNT